MTGLLAAPWLGTFGVYTFQAIPLKGTLVVCSHGGGCSIHVSKWVTVPHPGHHLGLRVPPSFPDGTRHLFVLFFTFLPRKRELLGWHLQPGMR